MEREISVLQVALRELRKLEHIISESAMRLAQNGQAQVFVALAGESVRSVATVAVDEVRNMLEVLDIYTLEEYRRRDIAYQLLEEVYNIYNDRMDYSLRGIMANFVESNPDAHSFFETLGFQFVKHEDSIKYVYSLRMLKNSYLMQKRYTIPSNYVMISYREMDNIRRRKIENLIISRGGNYDMEFAKDLSESFSYAVWNDEQLIGIVEIICEPNGELCLGQFFSLKMDSSILYVLQCIAEQLLENFPEDTKLSVYIVSESSKRLLLKLLGEDCERKNMVSAVLNFEALYDTDEPDEGEM